MSEEEKICPFCGQVVMTDENPMDYCDCDKAIFYRVIADAIEDFCGEDCEKESTEFKPVDDEVMAALKAIAAFRAKGLVLSVKIALPDGTLLNIGGKVSRSVSVKAEKTVI